MKLITRLYLSLILLFCGTTLASEFSVEALNWANENPVITVGIEDSFPPFDYVDKNGEPTGVGELIRQQLSDILPVNLKVTSKGSFAEQLIKFNEKKIDIISVCTATDERSDSMLFTKPFLSLTPIIVVHKESDFNAMTDIPSSALIGVPKGYASISSALRIVKENKVIEVDSTFLGVEMVNSGKLDGFVTYLSAQSYFIQKHGFSNVEALPIEGVEPTPLGFCVDQDQPLLVEILNVGINELGSDYFNHLQAEWIASLSNIDIKSTQAPLSLPKAIIFSLLILSLLILLMWRNADFLAIKFETLKFKIIYSITLFIVVLFVFFTLGNYFEHFKKRIVERQEASFNIIQEVTINQINTHYAAQLKLIKEVVRDVSFRPNVALLLEAVATNNKALHLKHENWLQAFFNTRPYTAEFDRHYKIISRQGRVLVGSRGHDSQESAIKQNYPLLFEKALAGESVFIPSINLDRVKYPVVHIIKPIKNAQKEVIALLSISYGANSDFSSLFIDVRSGKTGESYAINQQGLLLSESRFINQIHKEGTLPFGQSSILKMGVADVKGSPLAYDAIFQKSGRNLTGYQDYMGHSVAGQWTWNDKYQFMLVSEISIDEMYIEYTKLRSVLLVAMVLGISLLSAISIFMFVISHRANQMNRLSKGKLEELVSNRTQELATSEKKNSLIVESVADGILGLDQEGNIIFFNRAAEHILGYQEDSVQYKNYQDVLYSCDSKLLNKNIIRDQIKNSLIIGQNLHVEKDYFCHIDESEIPVSYSLSVISDDNSPFKAVITFQDISQRLRESERTKALLATLPVAIFVLNMKAKIVDVNVATEKLLGYKKKEILGTELLHYIPTNRQAEHKEIMEVFFADPKYVRMGNDREITVQTKTGEIIEVEAIFSLMEINGEQMTVISVLDITEANQAKNLLIEAKELADDASSSKSDFLANMSHEIRTPMNAIIGMSMLALQGELRDKEKNYVSKVHSAATNLLGIINDILDFSKIEAGKLELENQTFALVDMLDNFSTIIGLKTQEKGIDLIFNIDHDVPLFFKGDLLRLNQVLINLGGNAIKFTEQGDIVLKVSISEVNEKRVKLLFSVKDSGIGIKLEQLKKLFSAFSQADASTTRKYGGTGLGLSICKRLVELMNGDIWAESIDGVGSEFFFTTWLTVDQQDQSLQILETAQARLAGKRILIVDDSLITLTTLKEVVEGFGCEVFIAQSGKQALAIVDNISHFDFALIDWDMPVMNGLETCDALQDKGECLIEHIILISAYGREQIRESDYIDKVDSLLSKPITALRLHQALQSSLGYELDANMQPEMLMGEQFETLAGAHLLLVEDNELNQELATALLEAEGIIVSHAAHGEIAVNMVQSNSYDGILMDIQMPVMDGYKATQLIREFNPNIPILAMTANAMSGEKERVIEAGMNDYISKPINVQSMFSVINEWIKVKPNKRLIATPVTTAASTDPALLFAHFSHIDSPAGLSVCNGNNDLYIKILIKFEAANKAFHDDFMMQWQEEQWIELTRLVHSLKGGAGNIGAKTLYVLLNDLELACSVPKHDIDIQPLLDISVHEFIKVSDEIKILLSLLAKQQKQSVSTITPLTDLEIASKLNQLQKLVDEFDTSAQDIALELDKGMSEPEIKQQLANFIEQLEGFDFDSANQTLASLKLALLPLDRNNND